MGKLTVVLTDETEAKLRDYIAKTFPRKSFGKLSEVVEEALTKYLEKAEG